MKKNSTRMYMEDFSQIDVTACHFVTAKASYLAVAPALGIDLEMRK